MKAIMKQKNNPLTLKSLIKNEDLYFFIIFFIGIAFRVMYSILTKCTQRQHDFFDKNGHYDYIKIIANTFSLPTTNGWQFYHPPLSHGIMAVFYNFLRLFTQDDKLIAEFLQIIPLVYSVILMYVFYKILKEFNLPKKYSLIALLIFAVHPSNIILSGSMNNDMLTYLLFGVALLYSIKWYKKPSYLNIIILALAIALAGLSKFSGLTVAPITAILFLAAFIKNKEMRLTLIKQFCLFAIICLPLGLSHTFRQYSLFDQPMGYVPNLGKTHSQYIDKNIFLRLFQTGKNDFKSLFWQGKGQDVNLPIIAIKSSVFGEYRYWGTPLGKKATDFHAAGLLYSSVALMFSSLFLGVWNIIKSRQKSILKFVLWLVFVVQTVLYVYFNSKYPYSCTSDFRYLLPILLCVPFFFAGGLQFIKNRIIKIAFLIIPAVFTYFSIAFYLLALNVK